DRVVHGPAPRRRRGRLHGPPGPLPGRVRHEPRGRRAGGRAGRDHRGGRRLKARAAATAAPSQTPSACETPPPTGGGGRLLPRITGRSVPRGAQAAERRGSVAVKRVPVPTSLSTVRVPPSAVVRECERGRPRAVSESPSGPAA